MTVFRLILRYRLFAVLAFTSVGLFFFAIDISKDARTNNVRKAKVVDDAESDLPYNDSLNLWRRHPC